MIPWTEPTAAIVVFASVLLACNTLPAIDLNGQSNDTPGLKNARVRMVNGSSIRATIETIDESGKIGGSELINGITLNQIISIDTQRDATRTVDSPFVSLQFGGQQPFTQLKLNEESIEIENGESVSRKLPLELIKAITFVTSETVAQALASRTAENDSVVVSTSSGEKIVRGLVEKIDDTHVVLNYGGKSRRIALDKVRAVVMAKLDVTRAQGTVATFNLIGGSQFVGVINNMNKQQIDISLSQTHRLQIKCSEIQKISIQSDRVVYLSDLSPIREEEQTQFAAARTWQRDSSLLGNPIQLKFSSNNKTLTFDKGIGTRSYTSLVFPNDGFDMFRAVVGIDSETDGHGDCEMVVSGDGIRLWSRRIRATDDPQMLKLDIQGIEKVTLTVFPGEKFDLADHADWADARFTKN